METSWLFWLDCFGYDGNLRFVREFHRQRLV